MIEVQHSAINCSKSRRVPGAVTYGSMQKRSFSVHYLLVYKALKVFLMDAGYTVQV